MREISSGRLRYLILPDSCAVGRWALEIDRRIVALRKRSCLALFRHRLVSTSLPGFLWLGLSAAAPAAEPEYITARNTAPGSVTDIEQVLDQPLAAPRDRYRLLPRLRGGLEHLPPFLRDAQLTLAPRLYNFDRERSVGPDQVSFAAGGALSIRSGAWRERARLGAAMYTTQKLHGPREAGGGGVLLPTQTGFGVLGEAYAEIDLAPVGLTRLYRQQMHLPYLNTNDSRMIPITHEAYLIA